MRGKALGRFPAGREATKLHEEVLRGSAAELAALKREWKGEFVIGVHASGDERDES